MLVAAWQSYRPVALLFITVAKQKASSAFDQRRFKLYS
jgi:hypothetical protein